MQEWEYLGEYMGRYKVPGGWLYSVSAAVIFVPDPVLQVAAVLKAAGYDKPVAKAKELVEEVEKLNV